MAADTRLLLVGNPDLVHVGAHLLEAARAAAIPVRMLDTRAAFAGPRWLRTANWRLRGHRPTRLTRFSAEAVSAATDGGFTHVLTTGLAPIDAPALRRLGAMGLTRINFLTDDPWNPAHHAPWFLTAVREYDHVFTPRRANIGDLAALVGASVTYLPFGYSPTRHAPCPPSDTGRADLAADVMFAGGADTDRIAMVTPLIAAGLRVGLYGGYWDCHPVSRAFARGHLSGEQMPAAVAAAKICLCLVRAANRDGHSMRSFEVAAMGGCLLVEETDEHRALFGDDDVAVRYFRTGAEAAVVARQLLDDAPARARLAANVRERITRAPHTYRDRLQTMLGRAGGLA